MTPRGRPRARRQSAEDAEETGQDGFLAWHDAWVLGVDFMDADHQALAEALNRIARGHGPRAEAQEGTSRGDRAARLVTLLEDLGQRTREHFQREEEVMRASGYADLPAHKSEHDQLLAEHAALVRQVRASGQHRLDRVTLEALKDWLMGHMVEVDRRLATFLRETGAA